MLRLLQVRFNREIEKINHIYYILENVNFAFWIIL